MKYLIASLSVFALTAGWVVTDGLRLGWHRHIPSVELAAIQVGIIAAVVLGVIAVVDRVCRGRD